VIFMTLIQAQAASLGFFVGGMYQKGLEDA
jgi:hypothetical protein